MADADRQKARAVQDALCAMQGSGSDTGCGTGSDSDDGSGSCSGSSGAPGASRAKGKGKSRRYTVRGWQSRLLAMRAASTRASAADASSLLQQTRHL